MAANESRIAEVKQKGDTLIAKRHENSAEIKAACLNLIDAWNLLLKEVESRGRGL